MTDLLSNSNYPIEEVRAALILIINATVTDPKEREEIVELTATDDDYVRFTVRSLARHNGLSTAKMIEKIRARVDVLRAQMTRGSHRNG
jgi:hypothetical protein